MSDAVASLMAQVRDSYATPQAVAYYSGRALEGLRVSEQRIVADHFPAAGAALVIGCGAGREAFALEARGFDVEAIDVSAPLIEAARAAAVERRSRVRFGLTDGARLPFPEQSFDAVTLWSQVFAHIPTAAARLAMLIDVHRVLRPSGVVSLTAHNLALTLPLVAPDRLLSVDDPELGDVILFEDREQAPRYMHYFGEDELRRLCADAGLSACTVVHTSDLGEAWGNVFVVTARRPGLYRLTRLPAASRVTTPGSLRSSG